MSQHPNSKDWLGLTALVVFWGSSFAGTKVAVETIAPEWVVAGRVIVAAILLLAMCVQMKKSIPLEPGLWLWFAWLAVIGNALPFYLISWGTQHIPSGVAGILMAVVPLTVIILAHLVLPDEKLNRYKAAGFVIGFAGVVMLMGFDTITNFANQGIAFWAQLMIILATLCYAVHSISARIMPKVGPLEMSAAVMALAGVMMTGVALFTAPQFFTGASTASISSVVALGIFPTALASIVLYFLLTGAGPQLCLLLQLSHPSLCGHFRRGCHGRGHIFNGYFWPVADTFRDCNLAAHAR